MKMSVSDIYRKIHRHLKKQYNIIIFLVVVSLVIIPTSIESSRFFYYIINIIIFITAISVFVFYRRIDGQKNINVVSIQKNDLFREAETKNHVDVSRGVEIGSIVQFFLNLYRTQLHVSSSVPSRYFRLPQESNNGFQVYELKVFRNSDEWYKRRVTIGPIGVESGSRSNCFFATYDQNIVIKIPPSTLSDFKKYCHRIEQDRKTSSILEPIKSITPSVSWIMSKSMPQSENEFLSTDQVEGRYMHILKTKANLHEHLKIEGGFVYFMELSENYFMDQALRMIHDVDFFVKEEISKNAHLVLDPQSFQGRYGSGHSELSYHLSRLVKECESRISFYAKENGLQEKLPPHIVRDIFYSKLSDINGKKFLPDVGDDALSYVDQLFSAFFDEYKASIEEYYSILRDFVVKLRKDKLRSVFSSLTTNILNLLASLREKKIALRDLKPDNLFLDGKKDEFPQFLKSHDRYEIGLIDLETAVNYGSSLNLQPMLAGTPNYATPSHMFSNNTNSSLFGDLGNVFYMQDWHAVTAIIYRTVTFGHLFSDTSKYIFEVQSTIIRNKDEHNIEEFKRANSSFWKSAIKEFMSKLIANSEYMTSIRVRLTPLSCKELVSACHIAVEDSVKYLNELLSLQPYFKDKSKIHSLLISDSSDLEHGLLNNSFQFLKEEKKWDVFNNASEFLRFIISVKKRKEWYLRFEDSVKSFENQKITIFDLLVFMFGQSLRFYDKDLWNKFYLNKKLFDS